MGKLKYKTKRYKHIDKPIKYEKVKDYISDSKFIANHSFLPFLHFSAMYEKYSEKDVEFNGRPIKTKVRELFYASHFDSYIYRFYSDELNLYYNDFMESQGLSEVSLAYRTNFRNKSNIDFAAKAISTIVTYEKAWIFIGDFTSYFDNLDHDLLKKRLLRVMNLTYLSKDWYNVFKSITKYGYVDKEKLDKMFESNQYFSSYFESRKKFWEYKKKSKIIQSNQTGKGIPQGSAISGVLANIYAIDFDEEMACVADEYNGVYYRYSDDFILVLDNKGIDTERLKERILDLAIKNKIELQSEKTKELQFSDNQVMSRDGAKEKVDFLGFVFDGKSVKMREKSIYKFYRKSKRLIKLSKRQKIQRNLKKLPNRHKIYSLYTDFGRSEKYRSSFITYAKRAQKIFDNVSPNTENLMMHQLKNRKRKIESYLGYRIHSRIEK